MVELSSERSTPFVFAVVALFFRFSVRCKLTCNDFSNAQNHIYPLRIFRIVSFLLLFRWLSFYRFQSNSSAATNDNHCSDGMHHWAANRMPLNWEIELCRYDSDDTTRTEKKSSFEKTKIRYIFTLCISMMMRRSLQFKCKSFLRMKNSSHDACLLIKLMLK